MERLMQSYSHDVRRTMNKLEVQAALGVCGVLGTQVHVLTYRWSDCTLQRLSTWQRNFELYLVNISVKFCGKSKNCLY